MSVESNLKKDIQKVEPHITWQNLSWEKRLFGADRFGILLILILLQLILMSGFSHRLILLVAIAIQILTLFVAIRSSGIRIRTRTFLILWVTIFLVVVALVVGINYYDPVPGFNEHAKIPAYLVAIVLDLTIIGLIIRRLVSHAKINLSTIFGALCIYLQIGLFFAAVYALMGIASGGNFFAGQDIQQQVIYVYYSYTCLTTVGFGDFVAAANLGRMLSVSESIIGQIYLVAGVALIVGSLGRNRRSIQ
jgi:hypothetical protein